MVSKMDPKNFSKKKYLKWKCKKYLKEIIQNKHPKIFKKKIKSQNRNTKNIKKKLIKIIIQKYFKKIPNGIPKINKENYTKNEYLKIIQKKCFPKWKPKIYWKKMISKMEI